MGNNIKVSQEKEEASNLPLMLRDASLKVRIHIYEDSKEMLQLSISLNKEKKKGTVELLQSAVKIRTMEAAMSKPYEFWNTQPVPKLSIIIYHQIVVIIHDLKLFNFLNFR